MINFIISFICLGVLCGLLTGLLYAHDKRIKALEKMFNKKQCPKDYNNLIPGECAECGYEFNFCNHCGAPMNGFTCSECGAGYWKCPQCEELFIDNPFPQEPAKVMTQEEFKKQPPPYIIMDEGGIISGKKEDDGMPF